MPFCKTIFEHHIMRIRYIIYNIFLSMNKRKVTKIYGLKDNRILFHTFQNRYTCNPKYIAEELYKKNSDLELYFVIDSEIVDKKEVPNYIKLINRNSAEYSYIIATSKIWVDNGLNMIWDCTQKSKNQVYLNTWHGSLGIKKINGNKYWKYIAHSGNKKIDYFITNSMFEENVFKNSFWPNVKFLKYGHARNDLFFNKQLCLDLRKKICDFYNIDYNSKIFIYAPTFRDDTSDVKAINMDYVKVREALVQKFGGNWVILSRLHWKNASNLNTKEVFKNNPEIIDASSFSDIQELMAAADIGVTDYSSWIFDFILSGKPGFIYAEDINKYINSRGFYYPLSETPFAINESNECLCKNIAEFDYEIYKQKVDKFLNDKGCYENGCASKNISNFILDLINLKENEKP